MSWFGLFDRVQLRSGPMATGVPLPGSQLRLADPDIAALYRQAAMDRGPAYRCDLFDIAGHDLARRTAPRAGSYHVDIRATGRPQEILFAGDAGHGIIAWHEGDNRGTLRLAGGGEAVTLEAMALWPLLEQALTISTIPSLSVWAPDAATAEHLLRRLAPFFTADTTLILRLPPEALTEALAFLNGWPAQCAAILPCTGAADSDGRGEDPKTLLLLIDHLSSRPARDTAMPLLPVATGVWNCQERDWRLARHGGVAPRMPLPERGLTGGWTINVIGDIPLTPSGVAAAGLQNTAFRATAGFDYVLDIAAATILHHDSALCVLPLDGPAVLAPARLTLCDNHEPAAAGAQMSATRDLLAACGWLGGPGIQVTRPHGIARLASRPAFLLTGPCAADRYVSEIWPSLEYALQFCEQNRLALSDIDILIPGVDQPLVRESLRLLGFEDSQIHSDVNGVLYRQLLLAPPASHNTSPQRARAYDQFWARIARRIEALGQASFTRPRRPQRVMLTGGAGPFLLNMTALHDVARRHGYEVLDPTAIPFEDAAAILAGARLIVGCGTVLGWTCLATEARIGVLQSAATQSLPFAALHAASVRGFSVNLTFGAATAGLAATSFALAPDRFETLLNRLETGRGAAPSLSASPSSAHSREAAR